MPFKLNTFLEWAIVIFPHFFSYDFGSQQKSILISSNVLKSAFLNYGRQRVIRDDELIAIRQKKNTR